MDEYMEILEYDYSVIEDTSWNDWEYKQTVSGNDLPYPEDPNESDLVLGEILEALNGKQNYGTMGDYYNMTLGCYVFPNYEVYEYFIDIDAVGHEWAETSDGHYVPLLYLEAYEGYRSGDGEEEELEVPADVMPSEIDTETLETLESVRGLLSVIKENNTTYYDAVLDYQTEMLEIEQKSLAIAEGTLYAGITGCVLLGVVAGSFISHVFFGRMRNG